MQRSAGGETTGGSSATRFRRWSAHGLLVAVAMLVSLVMVGVAGSAGLTDPAAATGSGSPEPFTTEDLQAVRSLAAGAVVRVTGEGCGVATVGSGFAVDGVIVTNSHLVASARSVTVDALTSTGGGGGGTASAEVTRVSSILDLAEIEVDPAAVLPPQTELATGVATVGERVLLAGYGGGNQLRFVEASVHLVIPGDAYGIGGEVVLIDGASGPGFSGGPVLNRDGEVVAVLKGIDTVTGLTVATSAAMLGQEALFININLEDQRCR